MFRDLFGFLPPKTVTEIAYKDLYNRNLLDGGWERWMSFTYDEEVFARVLRNHGYKRPEEWFVVPKSAGAPSWWPTNDRITGSAYGRTHEDTQESEGYSFQEYIWHDASSNRVYFHKLYWD